MTHEVSLKTKPHIEAIVEIFREEVLDNIDFSINNDAFSEELEVFKQWFLEELVSDITGFIERKAELLDQMYPAEREYERDE